MIIIEKILEYKKYIILGIILLTIIGVIVYFTSKNQEKEEDFFDNFETTNTISEKKANKIKVHISGQVVNPGVIEIEEGSRIIDAIEEVGGLTEDANVDKVNLAYVLEDAMKIHIPSTNEEETSIISTNQNNEELKVNINTANEEDLQKVSGIGSSIANKIVTYRKQNGKFKEVEDLKNVTGIGESKFESIKNYLYVK